MKISTVIGSLTFFVFCINGQAEVTNSESPSFTQYQPSIERYRGDSTILNFSYFPWSIVRNSSEDSLELLADVDNPYADRARSAISIMHRCNYVYVDQRLEALNHSSQPLRSGIMTRQEFTESWGQYSGNIIIRPLGISGDYQIPGQPNWDTKLMPLILPIQFVEQHGYEFNSQLNEYVPKRVELPNCQSYQGS